MARRRSRRRRAEAEKVRVLMIGGGSDTDFEAAGADVTTIEETKTTAHKIVGEFHAVVLNGGTDIDPRLYGQADGSDIQMTDAERDTAEAGAVWSAIGLGLPVFGICRGAQMLNAVAGGTLVRDIDAERKRRPHGKRARSPRVGHMAGDHSIRTRSGSAMAEAATAAREPRPDVVSLHHQSVGRIAPGFAATAWAADGTIEAIETADRLRVGVQFHPELDSGEFADAVINQWVARVAAFHGLPAPTPTPRLGGWATTYKYTPPTAGAVSADKFARRHGRGAAVAGSDADGWDKKIMAADWRDDELIMGECLRCQITFARHADYLDHMAILHGVDLLEYSDGHESYATGGGSREWSEDGTLS